MVRVRASSLYRLFVGAINPCNFYYQHFWQYIGRSSFTVRIYTYCERLYVLDYNYITTSQVWGHFFKAFLSLFTDPPYQPSATTSDKIEAKSDLVSRLNNLIDVLKRTEGGSSLASKLQVKYGGPNGGDALYSIYKVCSSLLLTKGFFSILSTWGGPIFCSLRQHILRLI